MGSQEDIGTYLILLEHSETFVSLSFSTTISEESKYIETNAFISLC